MTGTFVISESVIAPALIVLFSYLIWVQSYQDDIADYEHVIRERYENQEFPWEGETEVITSHIRCEELDDWRYRIERILNPFRELEGHTSMHLWVVDKPELTAEDIENKIDSKHTRVLPRDHNDFPVFMHAVEPELVSREMEDLFGAIYLD